MYFYLIVENSTRKTIFANPVTVQNRERTIHLGEKGLLPSLIQNMLDKWWIECGSHFLHPNGSILL